MYPEMKRIFDLLEKHDLYFNIDSINRGGCLPDYEGKKHYVESVSYNLTIGNSIDMDEYKKNNLSLSLEILTDCDGKKYFQFYFDSSPLMSGNPMFYSPNHLPLKDLNEEFIKILIKKLIDE